ncbi:PilZ domain-containing protein [Chitiniphilus eburneus]|uniref:Pilus assembly protein PilZ n=1 Tax=Chitiniphilus eburneus TaxID=2571148 RepID=A0A4U0Q1D5_9NEIS|nr:PilZ domain-containing protein [Chitiniphilus eburneus]TJZ74757.1 pilus assembly protein PilZ [Chitiniphilus eburneus]
MEAPKPASRPGVLSLNIKEKAALYASYMPFVQGGGIFIPTSKPYRLADEVFMLLSLLDDPAKIAVSGHVVWVTPQGAHNNHQQGIGVQFSNNEAGAQARNKIEALLGGYLQSSRTTHTM